MKKIMLITLTIVLFAVTVQAQCYCACINNEKQMVCENEWEVPTGWCGGWCQGN